MTMMLHCGGEPATYQDLQRIELPPATRTYKPVGHAQMVDILRRAITVDLGMEIRSETFGLAQHGQQMFGVITVDQGNEDHALAFGTRNSLNKSLSAAFAGGGNVFVCDNLCFAGDVVVMRKHTTFVVQDIIRRLGDLLTTVVPQYEQMSADFAELKELPLNDEEAWSLLGRAVGHGILGMRQFAAALQEWTSPRHDAFAARTAWSLYNACTEAMKGTHPQSALERYTKLHALMAPEMKVVS